MKDRMCDSADEYVSGSVLSDYDASFTKYNGTSTNLIKTNNKNVSFAELSNRSVSTLQTAGYFTTREEFNNLISILAKESAGSSLTLDETNAKTNLTTKNAKLLAHIKLEYCFYYQRYNAVLQVLFSQLAMPPATWSSTSYSTYPQGLKSGLTAGSNTAAQRTTLITNLSNALATINTKLTNLITIYRDLTSTLNTYITQAAADLTGTGAGSTAALVTAIQNLNQSSGSLDILKVESNRRAVEYTKEKNRYSTLYLSIYAFLNISALAIVLHIATSK